MHLASQQEAAASFIDPLLTSLQPQPVLVDVGASAEVPAVWRTFARHSVYVGFDPDLREMRQENGGQFHTSFILNQAVVADGASGQVHFNLTRAAQCSSTLTPNRRVLDNYLLPERFDVLRQTAVAATTLDAAVSRLSLQQIDWLKLDTQGTDLRLFNSLSDGLRSRVLTVDAEPGLRGAYENEDLFDDLHAAMIRQGFWCAAATVKGKPRIRPSTLPALAEALDMEVEWPLAVHDLDSISKFPACPGWVECRYLRTVESLGEFGADKREYILLWAFALSAEQPGFAGDVAVQYDRRFGRDATWQAMAEGAARRLRKFWREGNSRPQRDGLIKRVRRIMKKIVVRRNRQLLRTP